MDIEQDLNINLKKIDNMESFMDFLEAHGVVLTEEHLKECFRELIENAEKI